MFWKKACYEVKKLMTEKIIFETKLAENMANLNLLFKTLITCVLNASLCNCLITMISFSVVKFSTFIYPYFLPMIT